MATTTLRVPITNVYDGGDYTAAISIGSEEVTTNVIMDTGSSTLAVAQGVYDPAVDANLKPTTLAQDIIYGTGGWTGPVVMTSLTISPNGQSVVHPPSRERQPSLPPSAARDASKKATRS